jgi:pilus assembly protein CpaB
MNRRFLFVALLLAILSAVLVYARISGDSGGTSTAAPGTQPVVVARQAIPQLTRITPEMLTLRSVPTDTVIAGSFTSIEAVSGTIAKFPIEANQQIVASSVVDPTRPVAGAQLARVVPTGKRAMSIQASQLSNAGGLILPGDYVDLIWTCCSSQPVITQTLLQNVQVAAVAQAVVTGAAEGDQPPVPADGQLPVPDAVTVTLLLTPEEAQQVFLAEQTGNFRVDLRGFGDDAQVDPGYTTLIDILPLEAVMILPESLRPQGYSDPPPQP